MSFVGIDGVMQLIEELFQYCWPTFLNLLPRKFQRMSYSHAMESYGTDKPDTRFENKLHSCTEFFKKDESDFAAYYITFSGSGKFLTDSVKKSLQNIRSEYGLTNFIQTKFSSITKLDGLLKKCWGDETADNFLNSVNLQENDVLFIAYGNKQQSVSIMSCYCSLLAISLFQQLLMGRIRKEFAKCLQENGQEIFGNGMHFLWITDFPLFEKSDSKTGLGTVHHPFTAPHPDDLALLETSPLKVRKGKHLRNR